MIATRSFGCNRSLTYLRNCFRSWVMLSADVPKSSTTNAIVRCGSLGSIRRGGGMLPGFSLVGSNWWRSGPGNVRNKGETRDLLFLAVFVKLEIVGSEIRHHLSVFCDHGVNLNEIRGDLDYLILIVG